jgi:hypothetical protein
VCRLPIYSALYQANKEMEKWTQMSAVEAFLNKDKIRVRSDQIYGWGPWILIELSL